MYLNVPLITVIHGHLDCKKKKHALKFLKSLLFFKLKKKKKERNKNKKLEKIRRKRNLYRNLQKHLYKSIMCSFHLLQDIFDCKVHLAAPHLDQNLIWLEIQQTQ